MTSTLSPPPSIDESLAPIEHAILVTRVRGEGEDIFSNTYPLWKPLPPWGIFGGTFIGQALQAAQQTVPEDFVIHRCSCSFLGRADPAKPLLYRVTRLGGGKSYVFRRVETNQDGQVYFSAECSFSKVSSLDPELYTLKLPELGRSELNPPKRAEASEEDMRAFAKDIVTETFLAHRVSATAGFKDVDPFVRQEIRSLPNRDTNNSTTQLHTWTRPRGRMSEDRQHHFSVLGFLTDSYFLLQLPQMNPDTSAFKDRKIRYMTSLNHTIWFHDPNVNIAEWLLVQIDTDWAAEGKCLMNKRIWSADGKLVVTCVQEAVLKVKEDAQLNMRKGAWANKSRI